MQVYHYCFCFLAFIVLIASSRYVEQSLDGERDEDMSAPSHRYLSRSYYPHYLERYLRKLIAMEIHDDDKNDESIPFERRTKAITKGDPREFMG